VTSYGIWSLVPPILAIGMAYATRQVIPSLLFSIWIGATILCGGNPFEGFGVMFSDIIVGAVADPWNVTILTVVLTLGGMVGIMTASGGMKAVADLFAVRARTARGGQLASAFLGLAVFFDDYASALLVGAAMRPVTGRLRVSREKLSYICDSTSAPVAALSLISTWATYLMGVLRETFAASGIGLNSYEALIRVLPFQFYSILTLVFVFTIASTGRDYGPMRYAELRARRTGKLVADGAVPLSGGNTGETDGSLVPRSRWIIAMIPLIVVVLGMAVGLMITGLAGLAEQGSAASSPSVMDIIGHADGALSMLWAAVAGTLAAAILSGLMGAIKPADMMDRFLDGSRAVVVALFVLVLAWGIGRVCRELGTAPYLAGALGGNIPLWVIPPVSFLLGCLIAFATGTSYGTVAILIPIAVPLAFASSGGQAGSLLFATIGAVFTGAVFGDHCSPISDTTIMSSMACASDHIDHVRTQIPYAVTVAIITLLAGFVPAGFGAHPALSIALGTVLVIATVRLLGKSVE
jgi:Na+/H+ antiporter NhaC